MFILPLGLTARLRDIPWFSIAIVIVTALWMFSGDELHAYNRFRLNLASQQNTEWLLRKVKMETCRQTLNAEDCRHLEDSLTGDKARNKMIYLVELQRTLQKAKAEGATFGRLKDFLDESPPREVANAYYTAKAASDRELSQYQNRHGILTKSSLNLKSLLTAQFSHAGWMHLIGNLLVLLAFVVFVEQYLGPYKSALIYFAGGFAGLALFVLTINDEHMPLVGASANVFAMGGAFLVLFWRHKVRVFFSAVFVLNRQLLVPVWAYFVAFLLMREMAGTLQTEITSVAHGAHMGGFFAGAGLALLFTRGRRLPADIVYPYELAEMAALEAEPDAKTRRRLLLDLLLHNPGNRNALRMFLTEESVQSRPWENLPQAVRRLIRDCVNAQVVRLLEQRHWEELTSTIATLPRQWPRKEILPALSGFQIHRLEKELGGNPLRTQLQILLEGEVVNESA